jgi:hypothetical protein
MGDKLAGVGVQLACCAGIKCGVDRKNKHREARLALFLTLYLRFRESVPGFRHQIAAIPAIFPPRQSSDPHLIGI